MVPSTVATEECVRSVVAKFLSIMFPCRMAIFAKACWDLELRRTRFLI